MARLSLSEIVSRLGGELCGDGAVQIGQIAPLERAEQGDIGFVVHPKYLSALEASRASAVILPAAMVGATRLPHILVRDPYLYFAQVAQLLNPPSKPYAGVHASAVVLSPLPASVTVAPLVFIGEGCEIGENAIIGPGCIIEQGCKVGADTLLHARVVMYEGVSVGARCILHAGCVLGSDGFGFAPRRDGSWEKIPQIGGVLIGDDVEIGGNTVIDRGALDATVIKNGVKLDNLIQIAHNCQIGENSAFAAQIGIAGSTIVGKRVRIGGQSGIQGHIEVGDDVVLSARSAITKTTKEKGVYTSVLPSEPHKEWLHKAAHFKNLDKMAERIRALEKKIDEMEKKA